jgi:hypothetical protein
VSQKEHVTTFTHATLHDSSKTQSHRTSFVVVALDQKQRTSLQTMVDNPSVKTRKPRKQEWDDNYNEVVAFAKVHGHLNLPEKQANTRRLANWLRRQKKRKDVHNYQRDKLALLNGYEGYKVDCIGVAQDKTDEADWNANFDKLMEYKKVHDGRFVVAKNDKDNRKLYWWIVRQRYTERQERLDTSRKEKLLDAGFEFRRCKPPDKKKRYTAKQEKKWDDMYAELRGYHKEHGHCIVKFRDENHEALANWVSIQRVYHRQGLMDETRRNRLNELQFTWSIPTKAANKES